MGPMSTYKLSDCRHGRFLYNGNDEYIDRSLEVYGEWSEAEVRLFAQILRPGDVVVEAGSNIGTHTVPLSRMVGEAGCVHAFEAARTTHHLLCANLALNECFNVQAHGKAIGAARGQVHFPVLDPRSRNNFGGVSPALLQRLKDLPSEPVEAVAVDDLGLDRLALVKSDIEGGEPELLRGAAGTIGRLRPVLYLEINGNRDELVGLVEQFGYHAYYYLTPMFLPGNVRGFEEDVFHAFSADLLCMPAENQAIEGLTRARVGDDAFRVEQDPHRMVYSVMPWNNARPRT